MNIRLFIWIAGIVVAGNVRGEEFGSREEEGDEAQGLALVAAYKGVYIVRSLHLGWKLGKIKMIWL